MDNKTSEYQLYLPANTTAEYGRRHMSGTPISCCCNIRTRGLPMKMRVEIKINKDKSNMDSLHMYASTG